MNVITILCDTLRRDHVGAYSGGRPLDQCWSAEAPAWSVPTPNSPTRPIAMASWFSGPLLARVASVPPASVRPCSVLPLLST
ncbi:MAG: hypothetical protein VXW00_03385, partial [Candidatus Latescibacterota bacterium]|nr:hypothetical protein [Candidatus Latescibacterota bacterium]